MPVLRQSFKVWEENREEAFGRDGVTITRTLRVEPFEARLTVLEALLGGVALVGGQLIRIFPARDPWIPWCWCQDAKVVPVELLNSPGTNLGLSILAAKNYSESARIVATYKNLEPETAANKDQGQQPAGDENSEKELASETWDFSAQSLTLPNQFWKWIGTDTLLAQNNVAITRTIPKAEFVFVRHFCLKFPFTAFTQLLGRVNKSNFLTRRFLFAPEMLRFEGASTNEKVTNRGVPFIDVTYKFAVQPVYDFTTDDSGNPAASVTQYVGWNRLYRPDIAKWDRPVATGNPLRRPYNLDEDVPSQTIGGREIKGFNLLCHPLSS